MDWSQCTRLRECCSQAGAEAKAEVKFTIPGAPTLAYLCIQGTGRGFFVYGGLLYGRLHAIGILCISSSHVGVSIRRRPRPTIPAANRVPGWVQLDHKAIRVGGRLYSRNLSLTRSLHESLFARLRAWFFVTDSRVVATVVVVVILFHFLRSRSLPFHRLRSRALPILPSILPPPLRCFLCSLELFYVLSMSIKQATGLSCLLEICLLKDKLRSITCLRSIT